MLCTQMFPYVSIPTIYLFTDNACSYQITVVDEIKSQWTRAGNALLSARKYLCIFKL